MDFPLIAVVERIMRSEKRKVHLGNMKFPTLAIQCGIVHEVFILVHFRFCSTNHKREQTKFDNSIRLEPGSLLKEIVFLQ